MRILLFAMLFAVSLLTACVVEPGPYGEPTLAPALPPVVTLQDEPYYYNRGYYYWYHNDAWYYSHSRNSKNWHPLPRDRYPREFRYKGRHWDRQHGWDRGDHDHDRDRDRDRGGGYGRY
jgi:hypothetical protein